MCFFGPVQTYSQLPVGVKTIFIYIPLLLYELDETRINIIFVEWQLKLSKQCQCTTSPSLIYYGKKLKFPSGMDDCVVNWMYHKVEFVSRAVRVGETGFSCYTGKLLHLHFLKNGMTTGVLSYGVL